MWMDLSGQIPGGRCVSCECSLTASPEEEEAKKAGSVGVRQPRRLATPVPAQRAHVQGHGGRNGGCDALTNREVLSPRLTWLTLALRAEPAVLIGKEGPESSAFPIERRTRMPFPRLWVGL